MKQVFRRNGTYTIPKDVNPSRKLVLFRLKKETKELSESCKCYWTGDCAITALNQNLKSKKHDYVMFMGKDKKVRKEIKATYPVVDVDILRLDKSYVLPIPKDEEQTKPVSNDVLVNAFYANGVLCFATKNKDICEKAVGLTARSVSVRELLASSSDELYAVSLLAETTKVLPADNLDMHRNVIVATFEKAEALKEALHDWNALYLGCCKASEAKNTCSSGKILTRDEFLQDVWHEEYLSPLYLVKTYENLDDANKWFADSHTIPEFHGEFQKDTTYIYTDGSASPSRAVCGWAFVAYQDNKEVFCDKAPYPVKDNKRATHLAEFLAVLNALDFVISNNIKKVVLLYDNADVFNVAYATSSADIRLFYKYTGYIYEKWSIIERLGIDFRMAHVKAHSGIEGNTRADLLAKSAVQIAGRYDF